MKKLFIINLLFFSSASLLATEVKIIDLETGLREAQDYSKKIQANELSYQAALERSRSLRADNFPQLSLDGQYKHLSHIPSVTLPPPISKTIDMGNEKNYSAGISLNYLITDFGQTRKSIESAKAEADAEKQNKNLSSEQLKLSVKNVYYKLLFQTSQLKSLFDFWQLAKEQEKDMGKRFHAGTSSKIDYTNATKDTLVFKLKFLQTQAEFSSTLQDWLTLTGEQISEEELHSPLPQELSIKFPEKTSIAIKLSGSNESETKKFTLNTKHPAILQLENLQLAQKLSGESITSSYLPRLSVGARASREYPDMGKDESYSQKSIYLSLTMPLWDGGKRSGQVGSFYAREHSIEAQKENLKRDLEDSVRKMKQLLYQLKEQIDVAREGTKDAKTLARLTYQSYINGKTNYLQVQSANQKILEWETQVDSLLYAKSLALAQLEYLGESK